MPKILVSADIICYFNSTAIGQVEGFRFSSSTPYKEIYALDSLIPYELTPTITRITGTVGMIRLYGDGGLEGQGITTRFEALSLQKYFTLTLRDQFTDSVVFQSQFTQVTDQNWTIDAKGIVKGSFSFTGIQWINEVTS